MFKKNRKTEHDGASRGREIFQQKNTRDRKCNHVSLSVRESKDFSFSGVNQSEKYLTM